MKVFMIIIETIYWIAIFLSPFLLFSAAALVIYLSNDKLSWISIALLVIGIVLGVFFAERIRRKYTCTAFMNQIFSTPDYYPVEVNDPNKANKEDEIKNDDGKKIG